ncbi:MAG: DUF4327 family protein [Cyanobacteria bacterium J06614_10]
MLQTRIKYSIQVVKDEAQALVSRGSIARNAQLYSLSRHFGDDDWASIESVLEANEYLLRDSICDLIGKESWLND